MSSSLHGSASAFGKGGGGGQARSPQEAPDSLFSRSIAKLVVALGEGEQAGWVSDNPLKDIYLDETPIMRADGAYNFSRGVTVDYRNGTQDQSPIEGYQSIATTSGVGVEVQQPTPVTRSYSGSGISRIRVIIQVPQLVSINTSNGDTNPTSFQFQIEVSTDNGPYVLVARPTVSGKASGSFQRAYEFPVSGSSWTVRLTRLTADSASATLVNAFFWQATVTLTDRRLSMPCTALLACTIDASEFSAIPAVTVRRRGNLVQVPSNYNPVTRSYSGIWDGTFSPTLQYTTNPAWVFYDLVTHNRYGLGRYIDTPSVDKWQLYAIGQYCDGLVPDFRGGTEPRFTCNVFLQSLGDATDVVASMASIFRGMAYYASGALAVSQDRPGVPVRQYSPANVIEERDDSGNVTSPAFSYSSTSRRARKTVAFVTWDDPDNRDQATVEVVQDDEALATYGFNPIDLRLLGCTSRGQAIRAAKWALLTNRIETDTVSFRVSLEGASVRPGDLIQISDPLRTETRHAGRLRSGSSRSQLVLDQGLALDANQTWTISVVDAANGSRIETTTLTSLPTVDALGTQNGNTLVTGLGDTLCSALTASVSINPDLTFEPQADTVYLVQSATAQARLYRVLSIAEQEPGIFQIQALQYRADKYAAVENNSELVDPLDRFTIRDTNPVTALDARLDYRNGSVYLSATWTPPQHDGYDDPQVTEYRVEYQRGEANQWRFHADVRATSVEISIPDYSWGSSWSIRVAARNGLGQQSTWVSDTTSGFDALPDISAAAYAASIRHQNQPDGTQLLLIDSGSCPIPERVIGYVVWAKPSNPDLPIPGVKEPEADGYYLLSNQVALSGYYTMGFHDPSTSYTVRVAFRSAIPGEQASTYLYDTVYADEIRPPAPVNFTVVEAQDGTAKRFSWQLPRSTYGSWFGYVVSDVVGYRIRYRQGALGSLTATQAWDLGIDLFSGGLPGGQTYFETALFNGQDTWTVMIRAVDATRWESPVAAITINALQPLPENVVATGALDPASATNTYINCAVLSLYDLSTQGSVTITGQGGDILQARSGGSTGASPSVQQTSISDDAYISWLLDNNDLESSLVLTTTASATYQHSLAALVGSNIPLLLENGNTLLLEDATDLYAEQEDYSAATIDEAAAGVLHPYAPYERLNQDLYLVRTRLRSPDGVTPAVLNSITYELDYADLIESFEDVVLAATTGSTITLTKPFRAVPSVQATLQDDGNGAVAIRVTAKSTSSVTLKALSSAGSVVQGLVDVVVKGY